MLKPFITGAEHCLMKDAEGSVLAAVFGETEAHALQSAQDIRTHLDAPLIVLGRSEGLRAGFDNNYPPRVTQRALWHVIHEGVRKQMTSEDIADVLGSLGFTN